MITRTYSVLGMACTHCEETVSHGIARIEGVESISIDIPSDAVTISSRAEIAEAEIRRAVEQAGYEFDGPSERLR